MVYYRAMKVMNILLITLALSLAGFAGVSYMVYNGTLVNTKDSVKNNETLGQVLAITKAAPEYKKAPEYFVLPSSKWIPQTFNNCGPSATAMLLQHFGYNVTQEETKASLRTGDDDKNIFMYEISDYLRSEYGISSKIFYNGNLEVVKTLIANGFYVMAEDWMHPNEDIGHVIVITGYDDREGVLIADDSYIGVGVKYPYSQFDELQWKPFNREFMPVYKPEQEELVKAIIGENWNRETMYSGGVKTSTKENESNPNDMYAWFNLGMDYFGLGNYSKARDAFEKSRSLGWPSRMLWYQIEPVITYNKLGEYDKAIELANIGLAGNESFGELQKEKAFALESLSN